MWAAEETQLAPRHRAAGRSRSPRRLEEGDASSLMEGDRSRPKPKTKNDHKGKPTDHRRRHDADEGRHGRARERSPRATGSGSASSYERPELPRSRGRCTSEVRNLLPPRRLPSPMRIHDATLWWLHLLGLRDGPETDGTRALRSEGQNDRLAMMRDVPQRDLFMIMVGLLRVTAMLWVECCQLVYMHPHIQNLVYPDVEVEVEEEADGGDGTMWMQQWKRLRREEEPQDPDNQPIDLTSLLEDEEEARVQKQRREAMEAARAQEEATHEALQQEQADRQGAEHEAQRYRDWEDWTLQNTPSDQPRRLVTTIAIQHAGETATAQCSVGLARGCGIHFSIQMQEVAVPSCSPDDDTSGLYSRWARGAVSDAEVLRKEGSDMLAVFRLQKEYEEDRGRRDGGSSTDAKGSGEQDVEGATTQETQSDLLDKAP